MRRTLALFLVLALAGCGSEGAPKDDAPKPGPKPATPGAWPPSFPDADLIAVHREEPPGPISGAALRAVAERAAKDLHASELFLPDVLDVRGVTDRSDEGVPTGDLEDALRHRLAAQGFHVLARNDPKTPERAAVALPVYGFVDGVPNGKDTTLLRFHLEVARDAPGGSARVAWAFESLAIVKTRAASPPATLVDGAALGKLAQELAGEVVAKHDGSSLEVQPVGDRVKGFPVLAFDAALRARLVRRGVPVVWRRAPGVDAPPALSAGQSHAKSLDHARLAGDVTELPEGKAQLGLKLERFNPATRRLEIHAAFDRQLAR